MLSLSLNMQGRSFKPCASGRASEYSRGTHNQRALQEGEDVESDLGEATRLFGRLGDSRIRNRRRFDLVFFSLSGQHTARFGGVWLSREMYLNKGALGMHEWEHATVRVCPSKDSHPIMCRAGKADVCDVAPLSCRPGQEQDDSRNLSKKQQKKGVSGIHALKTSIGFKCLFLC